MIKILVVDDDPNKIDDVYSLIYEFSEIPKENIEYVLEIKNAFRRLQKVHYDLVILDIKLPNELGLGKIDEIGGVNLLESIHNTSRIKKPTYIVGLTSHDDSLGDYGQAFIDSLWALLKYNKLTDSWKDQIRKRLKYIVEWKKHNINEVKYNEKYDYDFALITAVEKEYRSVVDLNIEWKAAPIFNDSTPYQEGTIKGKDRDYKIVVARQHQMGMPAAGVLCMKLIYNFRPRYLCMLGIAAGKRNEVNLGDLLVASESWDYGSGKIRENKPNNESHLFEPDPRQIALDSELKEIFLQDYSEILYRIRFEWNKKASKEIKNDIKIHVGPLASGAAVIQDETVVKRYIDTQQRKLLGLDMETYATYFAATNCSSPKPKFFSIKSVCDFADKKKNDDYQSYASFVSSQFFYHLVSSSILK